VVDKLKLNRNGMILVAVFTVFLLVMVSMAFIGEEEKNIPNDIVTTEITPEPKQIRVLITEQEKERLSFVFSEFIRTQKINLQFEELKLFDYEDNVTVILKEPNHNIDVVFLNSTDAMVQAYYRNLLMSPEDLVAQSVTEEVFGESERREKFEIENGIYGYPYRVDMYMLYYNKSFFQEAGIDEPTSELTWESFDSLARSIHEETDNPDFYGTMIHSDPYAWSLPIILDGATPFDIDLYEYEELIRRLGSLQDDGVIPPFEQQFENNIHYSTMFTSQKIPMHYNTTRHINYLNNLTKESALKFEWGITSVPHSENSKPNTTIGDFAYVAVPTQAKNSQNAGKLIEYLFREKTSKILAEQLIIPVVHNDEVVRTFVENMPERIEGIESIFEQNVLPKQVMSSNADKILTHTINPLFRKIMTKRESVEDFQRVIEIERGNY
jgi:multiple sugar transport system substrate-binding protein